MEKNLIYFSIVPPTNRQDNHVKRERKKSLGKLDIKKPLRTSKSGEEYLPNFL